MLRKVLLEYIKYKNKIRYLKSYNKNISIYEAILIDKDIIFEVPIHYILNRIGIKFVNTLNHPITLIAYLYKKNISIKSIEEKVQDWYKKYDREDWSYLFDLKSEDCQYQRHRHKMKHKPRSFYRLPWETTEFISHKTPLYGPISTKECHYEVMRTIKLLQNIEAKGFSVYRQSKPIRGYMLMNEKKQFRFVIKGGQHRVAVLYVLGYNRIPVTWQPNWKRVILKDEMCNWPHVKNHFITKRLATEVFDFFLR